MNFEFFLNTFFIFLTFIVHIFVYNMPGENPAFHFCIEFLQYIVLKVKNLLGFLVAQLVDDPGSSFLLLSSA